jgi:peptidoglycan/xylan/chitin deacetylase (PgdA/CDA1 family)
VASFGQEAIAVIAPNRPNVQLYNVTNRVKRRFKYLVERSLVEAGAPAIVRFFRRHEILVLAYHNVLPAGARPSGDRSLHLPHEQFVRQLDVLADSHDVIALSTVPRAADRAPRPRAVITFDDAYHGALTIALPELTRRGMPATVFAAPGILGQTAWWDMLADLKSGEVAKDIRETALTKHRGEGEAILKAFAPQLELRSFAPEMRIATEEQLHEALRLPGITVASHTWSHANLAALPPAALETELHTSAEWLRARFDVFVPWLSYPYGRVSADAVNAAARAGFVGAMRVDGGWIHPGKGVRPHDIPRYNVPAGLSIDGFCLRLGGRAMRRD